MRIIQITDLHIGTEQEDTYGIDVRANLLNILNQVKSENPDHLVISGDLCYREGERSIYEWILSHLSNIDIPYSLLSGNHDDPSLLAEVFQITDQLQDGDLFYDKSFGKYPALFLDSTTGVLSSQQIGWLKTKLDKHNGNWLLFIHHPIVKAGVPFMDKNHSLKNKEQVIEILNAHPGNFYVFSGHYHVEKTVLFKNITQFITPSCFFQIDQHTEEFKVDHQQIGFREITIDNGSILNSVHYLK